MGQGVVQMRLIHKMQQDAMCKAAMTRALIFAGGDSKEMGNALVQRLHAFEEGSQGLVCRRGFGLQQNDLRCHCLAWLL